MKYLINHSQLYEDQYYKNKSDNNYDNNKSKNCQHNNSNNNKRTIIMKIKDRSIQITYCQKCNEEIGRRLISVIDKE